jgi:hypothetical protein
VGGPIRGSCHDAQRVKLFKHSHTLSHQAGALPSVVFSSDLAGGMVKVEVAQLRQQPLALKEQAVGFAAAFGAFSTLASGKQRPCDEKADDQQEGEPKQV